MELLLVAAVDDQPSKRDEGGALYLAGRDLPDREPGEPLRARPALGPQEADRESDQAMVEMGPDDVVPVSDLSEADGSNLLRVGCSRPRRACCQVPDKGGDLERGHVAMDLGGEQARLAGEIERGANEALDPLGVAFSSLRLSSRVRRKRSRSSRCFRSTLSISRGRRASCSA